MKKILLVVHAAQKREGHLNWTAFADLIGQELAGEAQVTICSLGDLLFVLDGEQTSVRDTRFGHQVSDFDLVVFRTIGNRLDEAIALAAFCRKKGIAYIDDYLPAIGNQKLSCAFVRWEHDLPVPKTLYGPAKSIVDALDHVGLPAIVKANEGKKGRDNYLAKTAADVETLLTQADAPRFVVQNHIPNDGDYRILVLNGTARLALLRTASGDSHLNNTSQGGEAVEVELSALQPGLVELAERAARLEKLAVAGTDLIVDRTTGQPYILEVNRAPQIATGAAARKKTAVYAAALKELIEGDKQ